MADDQLNEDRQPVNPSPASPNLKVVSDILLTAIEALEVLLRDGGVSIIQAAFDHTYFVHPDKVRDRPVYSPDRARTSSQHYHGLNQGSLAKWPGDGRKVKLDSNHAPQNAWTRYTGQEIIRGSGYSIRHIWGEPWNPDAFTAGWNFCYTPSWAGDMTESQHPHPELQMAIRQASWELYFRNNPVCDPPDFVADPGMDLAALLGGQPILVMRRESPSSSPHQRSTDSEGQSSYENVFEHIKDIRRRTGGSWVGIRRASRLLQGKTYRSFDSKNSEAKAKYCARRIYSETDLPFADIEVILDEHGLGNEQ